MTKRFPGSLIWEVGGTLLVYFLLIILPLLFVFEAILYQNLRSQRQTEVLLQENFPQRPGVQTSTFPEKVQNITRDYSLSTLLNLKTSKILAKLYPSLPSFLYRFNRVLSLRSNTKIQLTTENYLALLGYHSTNSFKLTFYSTEKLLAPVKSTFGVFRASLALGLMGFLILVFIVLWRYGRLNRQVRDERDRLNSNLELTLRFVGEGIIVVDQEHRILRLNHEAARLTGWSESEAQGRPLLDIYMTLDYGTREVKDNWTQRLMMPPTPLSAALLLEGRHGWGSRILERGGTYPLPRNEVGWIIFFKDVSEELALKDRLNHAQKMESIGLLTGGIAHDFNNMLSGIMGAAELIQDELPPKSTGADMLNIIIKTSERAASLTQKLLSFSRKGKNLLQTVEINSVVQEAVGILEHSVDKKIKISFHHLDKNAFVNGDTTLIQNSILNLGVNARDALPKGGIITIGITKEYLGESFGKNFQLTAPPGPYYVVKVQDNGKGMEDDVKSRLFDPFFTTKPLGEGTGLGLAAVLRCMKDHGGALQYQSELQKGTEFRLYFPCQEDQDITPKEITPVTTKFSGRILLVDDEEVLLSTVGEMLASLGFETVNTCDGEKAWELLQEDHDFSLALVDIMMPKLNGVELLKKIRKTYPQIKVVLMSGYTKQWEPEKLIHEGAAGFIQKPFLRKRLAEELGNILANRLDSSQGKP